MIKLKIKYGNSPTGRRFPCTESHLFLLSDRTPYIFARRINRFLTARRTVRSCRENSVRLWHALFNNQSSEIFLNDGRNQSKSLDFFAERCYNISAHLVRGHHKVPNSTKKIVKYISRIGDGKYILRHFIKGFKSWQKLMKGSAAWLRREPRNS